MSGGGEAMLYPYRPAGEHSSPDCGPGERQALGRCWA